MLLILELRSKNIFILLYIGMRPKFVNNIPNEVRREMNTIHIIYEKAEFKKGKEAEVTWMMRKKNL